PGTTEAPGPRLSRVCACEWLREVRDNAGGSYFTRSAATLNHSRCFPLRAAETTARHLTDENTTIVVRREQYSMNTTMPRLSLPSCAIELHELTIASPSGRSEDKIKVAPNESLFPGMSAERLRKSAQPFKSLLEHSTGFTGEIVPGGEALELADKLKKDD